MNASETALSSHPFPGPARFAFWLLSQSLSCCHLGLTIHALSRLSLVWLLCDWLQARLATVSPQVLRVRQC